MTKEKKILLKKLLKEYKQSLLQGKKILHNKQCKFIYQQKYNAIIQQWEYKPTQLTIKIQKQEFGSNNIKEIISNEIQKMYKQMLKIILSYKKQVKQAQYINNNQGINIQFFEQVNSNYKLISIAETAIEKVIKPIIYLDYA